MFHLNNAALFIYELLLFFGNTVPNKNTRISYVLLLNTFFFIKLLLIIDHEVMKQLISYNIFSFSFQNCFLQKKYFN